MKRKYFFVILFLIFAIFLSGCSGIVTPATDEEKVKSVLNEYFLAISNQNWDKAKNCCLPGSIFALAACFLYDMVLSLQTQYHTNTITITCYANNYNVIVTGNYAEAYFYLTFIWTAAGYPDPVANGSGSKCYYLEKIGNSWKIYKHLAL